jgi:hypothetical protein
MRRASTVVTFRNNYERIRVLYHYYELLLLPCRVALKSKCVGVDRLVLIDSRQWMINDQLQQATRDECRPNVKWHHGSTTSHHFANQTNETKSSNVAESDGKFQRSNF